MPNVIKSATTVSNGTIKRNNFLLGVNTLLPYGPTDNGVVTPVIDVTATRTFFWNGINPPPGGYTIYVQKASGGPSIFVVSGDSGLISAATQNGGSSINTVTDALSFFNGQSNYLVTNIEYPSIVTSGLTLFYDAGFVPSYPRTGTTWNDLSGNNYSGTLVNTPTFSGASGGYFSFDGTDDYMSTTYTTPAQNATTSFSWNCWIYPIRNNNNDIFMGNRNTTLNFIKLTSNNFEYYPISFGGTMTLNVWQNICVVKNLTNFFYYKNGTQIATTTSSATLTTNPFFIGGDNTAAEYGQGRVAISTVYDRALSATEILQNYNALLPRYSLVLYWDIANTNSYPGTGTTVTDLSGNGNNGTIGGTVTYNTNNGGVLTTNGSTGYIQNTSINLATSNFTVIGGSRYNGATRARMITSYTNNWLLGHWQNSVANYYSEGWVSPAAATGGSDTTWRIYTGTGNIAEDSYAFYINSTLTNGPNSGGAAGPNGISIGRWGNNGTPSEYSTGDFSFLMVFNTVLSSTEISSITNSFRGRFGI